MVETRPELVGLYRPPFSQAGRYGQLRLDKNEHTEGWSKKRVQQMMAGVTGEFLAAYPEPGRLYEAIAHLHRLKVENVLVTAGSEMAIRYVFETYLSSGQEVVFLEPSFAMFDVYASICGARRTKILCGTDLRFSVNDLLAHISAQTKVVAIANPNNPTGTVIAPADIRRIAQRAASKGSLLLVDEAYYEFYGRTALDCFARFDNLIVTRTFSKAYGLAAVRLGYALAHPSVINQVRKLQPIDHTNSFAIKCGLHLLSHPAEVHSYVAKVKKGRFYLAKAVRGLGLRTFPSHGNFLVMDLRNFRVPFIEEARKRHILVPETVRLPFESNYLRVTIGTPSQMRQMVAVLKAVTRQ